MRKRSAWLLPVFLVLGAALSAGAGRTRAHAVENTAAPMVFYASSSGKRTLDRGEGGGNPFASALIELLGRPALGLRDFPNELKRLTVKKSGGRQVPEIPAKLAPEEWQFSPKREGEKRVALVMVFSDYSGGGARSLPGAKYDAERISSALEGAGFETQNAVDPERTKMATVLAAFKDRSTQADIGVLYVTGHGAEVDGTVYLLPGDFPANGGADALVGFGLALPDLSSTPRAALANFVFYGGCRDNPFKK